MTRKKSVATVTIALVAGLVGYIIGPPIVQAATSAVKISSGTKASQLKVSGGRGLVDTEADTEPAGVLFSGRTILTSVDFGLVFTQAGGGAMMGSGTSSGTACANTSIVSAFVVDGNSNTSPVTVTVSGDRDFGGAEGATDIWQGTVGPGGHLNDTMDGGIFLGGPLTVAVAGTGAKWYAYGVCFSGTASAKSVVLRALMQRRHAFADSTTEVGK